MKKPIPQLCKLLVFIAFQTIWLSVYSQSANSLGGEENCLVMQPDSIDGISVELWNLQPDVNLSYNIDFPDFIAAYWTWNGNDGLLRSLLKFDLSSISPNAIVDSAILSLYWSSDASTAGQAGSNASYLLRVTTPWNKNTVTWNTQPSTSSQNKIILPQSISSTQDYPHIDITQGIQDMVSNPSSNNGFLIQLQDESIIYSSMKFCSGKADTPSHRPKLKVCYSYPAGISILSNQGNNISIYPNPAGEYVNMMVKGSVNRNYEVSITNLLGQKVRTEKGRTGQELQIDRKNLAPGLYMYEVTINGMKAGQGKITFD